MFTYIIKKYSYQFIIKFIKIVNNLKIKINIFLFYLKTQPQHTKSTLYNNTKTNNIFYKS